MTREEALERHDRIRYSLLNAEDKAAVDVAFDALATSLQQESSDQQITNHLRHNGLDGFGASLATENQVTSDWISVEDRLPEPNHAVLVHRVYALGGNGSMTIDHILSAEPYAGTWFGDLTTWKSKVTHWMPLPSTEGLE